MPVIYKRRKTRRGKMNHTYAGMALLRKYSSAQISLGRPLNPSHAYVKGFGFPDEMTTHLKYNQTLAWSAVSFYYQFRGNSVFDPDYTGGGNQPNFYDNLNVVYGKYKVMSSTITVSFQNLSATIPARVLVMASDIVTLPTNSLNAAGNNNASLKHLGVLNGAGTIQTITKTMSTAKINGKDQKHIKDSDQYESLVTASPADAWFWNIMVDSYDFANVTTGYMDVKITYTVRFTDRFLQNLS